MPKAIVTGASSGLGLAVTKHLLHCEWDVLATYRSSRTAPALESPRVSWHWLDLSESDSIQQFTSKLKHHDDVTVLINNAGYQIPVAAEDLTRPVMEQQFAGVVFGTIELTNKVVPYLISNNGRIIFINSVFGFMTFPYRGAYVAAKHALSGYANALSLELDQTKVQVCSLYPGAISGVFRQNSAALLQRHESDLSLEHSRHRHNYAHVMARIQRNRKASDRFTSAPEAIARHIYKLLCKRRMPRQTFPGLSAKLIRTVYTLLPASWFDRVACVSSRSGRV